MFAETFRRLVKNLVKDAIGVLFEGFFNSKESLWFNLKDEILVGTSKIRFF